VYELINTGDGIDDGDGLTHTPHAFMFTLLVFFQRYPGGFDFYPDAESGQHRESVGRATPT
jgi:hypothetical protein